MPPSAPWPSACSKPAASGSPSDRRWPHGDRDAAAQLAVFEALAAEWRWMATGTGAPADHAMLPAITAALDTSIATIAEIAMEDGGLSTDLAAQAEWVIAMAWHL
jgi:hypothetical protein